LDCNGDPEFIRPCRGRSILDEKGAAIEVRLLAEETMLVYEDHWEVKVAASESKNQYGPNSNF